MSKSTPDEKSKILLSDTPSAARKKIMSAATDSVGVVNFNWEAQPGITNLLQLLSLLNNVPQAQVNAEWVGNERYGDLKAAVAESVVSFLEEFQTKLAQITDAALLAKLEESEQAMSQVANKTLLRAQRAVGLRPEVAS